MTQNNENNPGFIHSASMRRSTGDTKTNANLLGMDSAQVSVSAELFIKQSWLSAGISGENPLNFFVDRKN